MPAPPSETHLLNMAVCLHSEVMHFGAAVTSWSQTAAGMVMNEDLNMHTHLTEREKG